MNCPEMKITNGSSENGTHVTTWRPGQFLESPGADDRYAIVVLNRPLAVEKFDVLWNGSSLRVIVDGGMNRFLDFRENNPGCSLQPPDLFTGDFDSCLEASMDFAKAVECEIVKTPDQNETDFTKALRAMSPKLRERDIGEVLVVCETSGRLDQIAANINTMFKARKILPEANVFLLSSNSLSWLLPAGSHAIHIPSQIVAAKRWCGLVPFTRTLTSTSGLKWNLDNNFMEFGGMVSTSNTYRPGISEVKVTVDSTILWSMGTSSVDD